MPCIIHQRKKRRKKKAAEINLKLKKVINYVWQE